MRTLREFIADTEHRELLDWWFAARGGRAMPSRADFDPVEHPRFLPRIFLVEIASTPPHFVNRLCGTEIDEQQGYSMTGKPFEETFAGALLDFTTERFADVAFNGLITCYSTIFTMEEDGARTQFTRLLLPFSDDGQRVDMVLGSRIQAGDVTRTYRALLTDPQATQRHEIAVVAAADVEHADVTILTA